MSTNKKEFIFCLQTLEKKVTSKQGTSSQKADFLYLKQFFYFKNERNPSANDVWLKIVI